MRRYFFCLVIVGFVFSGCSARRQPEPETRFFRDFSLPEVVSRINAPELKPGSSNFGSSSSPGVRARRDFELFCPIEERGGTIFDEEGFITRLKVETEKAASDAGVRVNGGGSKLDGFHFYYSAEDHEGWLEVVGTRMEDNEYKLWGVIIERTGNAKL